MHPDIYIRVRFKTSEEGGRKTSLKRKTDMDPYLYGCPLMVDDKTYDCRLLIEEEEIKLGKYYEIPVKFLDKDLALSNLAVGKGVTLLEGKEVAKGQVIKICD